MKRKFTILAALALLAFLAIPMGMRGQTRAEVTWTASEQGYTNGESLDGVSIELDDYITIQFDKNDGNNAPAYYNTGTAARLYPKNSLTVTPASGYQITGMTLTFSGTGYTGTLGASVGSYSLSSATGTWSGSSTSAVVLTNNATSGHARMQVLTVTYSETGGPQPTTYTVTYNANVTGVASIVDTYNEGANVTLRAANTFTNEGYTFSEWNTQADGDGDAYEAEGTIENIQENIELYAIWTENAPSNDHWVLTNLADLTASDVFVIVGNGTYAMTNNNGTASAPATATVTITGNEITGSVDANIQWTVSGDATNGYTFYPNGSTTVWLYCNTTANSSSNNNMRVGIGDRKVFELNSNNYLITKDNYVARYLSIYNNADWRGYTGTSNGVATMSFYKKVTGGIVPPSISAENVSIEYNATSGNIAYTINNGVDGGVLTAATESNWLTLGNGTTSPISFTCTANEEGTARTATVTLTYTYNRETATQNVTVTQAGNPDAVDNISDITDQGQSHAVRGTVVGINNRGFVLGDGTGYVYIYLNAAPEVSVGDIRKVSGTTGSYNHVIQYTNSASIETATTSNYNNTPAVQVLDATGIVAYSDGLHLSDYVQIQGLLNHSGNYYNITIDGLENTASISYPNDAQQTLLNNLDNKQVIIKGYFAGVASGHFNVILESIEEVVVTEPTITIANTTVSVPTEGGNGTITVTYENIEPTDINPVAVFYAEDGETSASYDWITVEFDSDNNAVYTVTANSGEARTAYFKVHEQNNDIYSNLVTVNQAAYVAPTYAELPFEFNGVLADIENTDGLYQEGLGDDYNSAPKLKFDGTGDWLLLQFNERPGTLTFDIKGNSFSGGTFTVQTSEDGETYTDLASYTELGNTQNESFDNLGADVRYIKWIYTEKVSGNVALGNIVLTEYVAPQQYTLTVEPFENLELITFVNDEMAMEADGQIQVYNGDHIMLSIVADEGYVMETLMVNDVNHVNDIAEDFTYEFNMPAEAVTISATAVEYVAPTPGNWVLTSLADLTEDDVFVIVGDNGDTYAMPYDGGGQSGAPAAVAVTVADGTLSEEPAANLQWNLGITNDGYIFYPNGVTENWLYCTNTNNGVRVGTNENKVFTMGDDGYLKHTATSRYVGIYNSQDWRCYTTNTTGNIAGQTFAFYKKVESPVTETYTLEITGYSNFTNPNGGYYLIASPVTVNPADVEGMTEGSFDLYYFDEAEDNNEWQNWKDNDETGHFNLVPGKGYLYAHQEGGEFELTGTPYTGDGTITLNKTNGTSWSGWNLVGNPFGETAYIQGGDWDFYVMNQDGLDLEPAEVTSIGRMQGIFVVANSDGEQLTLTTEAPTAPQGGKIVVNVRSSRGNNIDRAMIRFGEGRQLPKFQLNPDNTKLYIAQEGEDFAVVRSIDENSTPVSFRAAENGIYTLSVNADNIEMEYLHLIDNMTGNDIDLLATPSYTFEARTTDYADRFNLVYATCDDVNENNMQPFAFFNGSEWVINNAGNALLQVVDVTGRVISSETLNGNAHISLDQVPGVYVMRLVSGNNVKVQKVIIK